MKYIATFSILILLGCNKQEDQKPLTLAVPNQEHDFELVQLGTMRRDQYLLDKKTGHVWKSVCMFSKKGSSGADCDYSAWLKEDVQDLNGSTSASIDGWTEALRKKYSN